MNTKNYKKIFLFLCVSFMMTSIYAYHDDLERFGKNLMRQVRLAHENSDTNELEKFLEKHQNNIYAFINYQDEDGWTPLMDAAYQGNPQVIEILLQAQANINKQNSDGETALMIATRQFQNAAAFLLLEHHPNLELKNNDGQTVLDVAAKKRNAAVGRKLLELLVEY